MTGPKPSKHRNQYTIPLKKLSINMQLKKYQQKAIDELRDYVAETRKYATEKAAGIAFMARTDKQYNWVPELKNAPFVCVKVPTGGGKTLIAAHSIDVVVKGYLGGRNDKGLVIWFVPSDAIRSQTLDSLRNRNHPYRAALDQKFNNAVKVFNLSEAKSIKKDDLADNLCIVVVTLSAFRRTDKEWLKVFQDNGALMSHFERLKTTDLDFLDKDSEGEIIYSLANIIKLYNPLVIVDEGHNIQTGLSFKMLENLNPSFVLEFTATPKGDSNVLVNVPAKELKDEHMIKMPVYLANKTPWQEAIYDGIDKLRDLERRTKKLKNEYIRPIMLLQAEQEKESSTKVYVEKVKKFLIDEVKIPEDQIAVKTSKQDNLPKWEILSKRNCPIRFIITVNALREGWDCPFAYVLVSVSNMGAHLSVEQTMGRIMRLPKAEEKSDNALNSAYVFAATRNFNEASEVVIRGLESNGYEGMIRVEGGVSVGSEEFKRKVSDANIRVPYICIKDGGKLRKLDYVSDLLPENSLLSGKDCKIDFHPIEDNKIEKIDIGSTGELTRDLAGRLNLIYHYEDFTKEDFLSWLKAKIQRSFISIGEMGDYLETAVNSLLKSHKLDELSVHRYPLKEAIDKKIDEIIDNAARDQFKNLVKKGFIESSGENFDFGKTTELLNPYPATFSKHLFERAGSMNREESNLAYQLDGLKNILWWFRNPDIGGFYMQGWAKNKFYPDFIAKTKKGTYFVLEYKGEHLEGSEDTKYKEEVGRKWAELAGKKYRFELVDRKNLNRIIEEISKE